MHGNGCYFHIGSYIDLHSKVQTKPTPQRHKQVMEDGNSNDDNRSPTAKVNIVNIDLDSYYVLLS